MKRWKVAVVAALLGACVAGPVQAAEWCIHDPQLKIQTSPGDSFAVYVTEGVLGAQHRPTLALAHIAYTTARAGKHSYHVTVYDLIPTDRFGTFATEMIVSSKRNGGGEVYGSTFGTSGTPMNVSFWIDPAKVTK